jgi:hypothetical protein
MFSSTRPHHQSKVQPKKSNHHRLTQYKNSSLRQKKIQEPIDPKTDRSNIHKYHITMGPESCGDIRKRKSRRRSEISTKRENQHTETYLPQDLIATVEVLRYDFLTSTVDFWSACFPKAVTHCEGGCRHWLTSAVEKW